MSSGTPRDRAGPRRGLFWKLGALQFESWKALSSPGPASSQPTNGNRGQPLLCAPHCSRSFIWCTGLGGGGGPLGVVTHCVPFPPARAACPAPGSVSGRHGGTRLCPERAPGALRSARRPPACVRGCGARAAPWGAVLSLSQGCSAGKWEDLPLTFREAVTKFAFQA